MGIFWNDTLFYTLAVEINISTAIYNFCSEVFVLIDVLGLTDK